MTKSIFRTEDSNDPPWRICAMDGICLILLTVMTAMGQSLIGGETITLPALSPDLSEEIQIAPGKFLVIFHADKTISWNGKKLPGQTVEEQFRNLSKKITQEKKSAPVLQCLLGGDIYALHGMGMALKQLMKSQGITEIVELGEIKPGNNLVFQTPPRH